MATFDIKIKVPVLFFAIHLFYNLINRCNTKIIKIQDKANDCIRKKKGFVPCFIHILNYTDTVLIVSWIVSKPTKLTPKYKPNLLFYA